MILLLAAAAAALPALDCSPTPAWRESGLCAAQDDAARREKLPAPGVQWKVSEASATRAPWVDANGWRFLRNPHQAYLYDLPPGAAALAAAEAFAWQANALLRIDSADREPFARLLAFLRRIPAPPLPDRVNIGLIDDGSPAAGEAMNLLARRNLLFRLVSSPDPALDLNLHLGPQAADPSAFAAQVRRRLSDEKRLLRIYGSDVVLGRLTGDAARARLHLLNYGGARIEGLRVRVLGAYPKGVLAAAGHERAALTDYAVQTGATEFTIPEMSVYAVVDLTR